MRLSVSALRGQHQDRHRGGLAQRLGELEAGLARHHHVEYEQVERQAFELGARVHGVVRRGDAIALGKQEARQQIADAPVVVDHEQMRRIVGKRDRGSGHDPSAQRARRARSARAMKRSTSSRLPSSIIAARKARADLMRARAEAGERARDAFGLQAGKLHGELFALRRDVKQAVAAIVRPLLLHARKPSSTSCLSTRPSDCLVMRRVSSRSATFMPGLRLTKCSTR